MLRLDVIPRKEDGPAKPTPVPRPGSIARSTSFRVLLLFVPSLILVVFLRLLEHSALKSTNARALAGIVADEATLPFVLLLLTLAFGLVVRVLWPRLRAGWLAIGTLSVGIGLLLLADMFLPPWYTRWVSWQAFEVIRWDMFFLMLLALLSVFVLEFGRGWGRRLYLLLLHILLPFLLLLPIIELSYIQAVGTPLDGIFLGYALRHLSAIAPLMVNEVTLSDALLLALPMGISLLPLLLMLVPQIRGWLAAGTPEAAPRIPWSVAGGVLPLLLLCLLLPKTELPSTHDTISYVGMAKSLFKDPTRLTHDVLPVSGEAAAAFDLRGLRLAATDSTRRLNVVVILLESFRSRSLTPYTPTLGTTPFIDSLAREGLLVEDMYAVVPYTNKSLGPILAGSYPEPSFEIVEAKPGMVPGPGLPTLLTPHGYRSAFYTPAKMAFESKDKLLENLGFEEIRGGESLEPEGFERANYFGYEDRIVLAPSLAWVDAIHATGEPFFLTYLTLTAHHDYRVPSGFQVEDYGVQDEELNAYLNTLRYTDEFLADLFDAFAERGLIDSTLFILLGDHGEAFGEHGLYTHGDVLWDEALHIPALLYNPLLFPSGRRIEGPRQYLDILPTIAEALNFQLEGGDYPGHSLLQPVPVGRQLFHNAWDGTYALALREDSLKFIYYYRRQPMQVFNIKRDPLEQEDIAEEIPLERRSRAEMQLLWWYRSVQQVYAEHAGPGTDLATQ